MVLAMLPVSHKYILNISIVFNSYEFNTLTCHRMLKTLRPHLWDCLHLICPRYCHPWIAPNDQTRFSGIVSFHHGKLQLQCCSGGSPSKKRRIYKELRKAAFYVMLSCTASITIHSCETVLSSASFEERPHHLFIIVHSHTESFLWPIPFSLLQSA